MDVVTKEKLKLAQRFRKENKNDEAEEIFREFWEKSPEDFSEFNKTTFSWILYNKYIKNNDNLDEIRDEINQSASDVTYRRNEIVEEGVCPLLGLREDGENEWNGDNELKKDEQPTAQIGQDTEYASLTCGRQQVVVLDCDGLERVLLVPSYSLQPPMVKLVG